ncbi:MAG: hypothetical protein HKN16_06215, partial [Saprospiraceae bacterium]|nr:hypothetical protein [Saprospiraceae bacterium]
DKNEESAFCLLDLANFLKQKGDQVNGQKEKPDTDFYLRAIEGATRVQNDFPEAEAARQAKALADQIKSPDLRLQIENVYPIGQPGLIKVDVKNTKVVYWKIAKLGSGERKRISKIRRNRLPGVLQSLEPVKEWSDDLDYSENHHTHAFESFHDGFDQGEYILIVSNQPKLKEGMTYQYSFFQVTNLALVKIDQRTEQNLFLVTERTSGKPISGASLVLTPSRGSVLDFQSDDKGMIRLKGAEHRNYEALLSFGNDSFRPEQNIYLNRRMSGTRSNSRVHFFLDRKIYRPDQSVYFKGIAINYDEDRKPEILSNHKIVVSLVNPNGEEVKFTTFTTNEFGSLHGNFVAPGSGLLGRFVIKSSIQGSTNFSVEEYKRPKFEVSIDPPKGKTDLNETIEISGLAKALAGYGIDKAKVKYRVTRQANFPWCPVWRIPPYYSRTAAEIAFGEATTDENGAFKFSFEAKPDRSLDPKLNPEFVYSIQADVTDGSGETRSSNTSVRAGYIGFTIQHNVPGKMDLNEIDTIEINSNNLAGQPFRSTGSIKFTQLLKPQDYFLERYWTLPDLYKSNKEEFKKRFPLFAYGDEEKREGWEKGEARITRNWTTETGIQVPLNKETITQGYYLLEVEGQDENGKKANIQQVVEVFDSEDNQFRSSKPFFFFTNSSSWQPGETYQLDLSTFDPVYLFHTFSGINAQNSWTLTGPKKEFIVEKIISDKNYGGLNSYTLFVRNNRVFGQSHSIHVPWKNKELQIELSS